MAIQKYETENNSAESIGKENDKLTKVTNFSHLWENQDNVYIRKTRKPCYN